MAKNILDAISNIEESVPESSFIVAKKIEQEKKKDEINDIIKSTPTRKNEAKNIITNIPQEDEIYNKQTIIADDSNRAFEDSIASLQNDDSKTLNEKYTVDKFSLKKNKPWGKKGKKTPDFKNIEITTAPEPLWLSVSEAAKTGGVEQKTIRRAIQSESVKFKIIKNRYFIEFSSMVKYLSSNTKLRNKFLSHGIGQYVDKWK